jgi:signal transduction histidine kinase
VLPRFARLDESRATPGSGLGLSLVAAVARLHGAELRLEDNRPGLRVVIDFGAERRSEPEGGSDTGERGGVQS